MIFGFISRGKRCLKFFINSHIYQHFKANNLLNDGKYKIHVSKTVIKWFLLQYYTVIPGKNPSSLRNNISFFSF